MAAPVWPLPPDVECHEVNGYPMAYVDRGSGTPLVLVHGSFCDYRNWRFQTEPFAQAHRVINASLRHYYPEPWNGVGADFSIAQHADDLAGLIQELNLGEVHLLGHSRGGAVAIELAKKHPELLRSLILADPAARLEIPETPEAAKALAFRSRLFANLRTDVKDGNIEGGTARFMDDLLGAGAWARMPRSVQEGMIQNVWTAIVDDPLPLTKDEELRKLALPVLTLTGEKSPPMYGLVLDEMLKRGNFPVPIVIDGSGHAMTVENPKKFNDAVLLFTKKVDNQR
jgi:pimeloyl-ACP methyl ester carboxylesterase